jgi:hypothetical protein
MKKSSGTKKVRLKNEGSERFSESFVGEERQLLSIVRYVGDNDKTTARIVDGK